MAPDDHKHAMIKATADDIVLTDAISGLPANFVRSRLEEVGLIDADGKVVVPSGVKDVTSWQNTWSAGHGVGQVRAIEPVSVIVDRLDTEYRESATGYRRTGVCKEEQ